MVKVFLGEKYSILLFLSLINVILAPFVPEPIGLELFLDLTFTLIMVTAVLAVSQGRRRTLLAAIVVALPGLFFMWWTYFYTPKGNVMMISTLFQALFIAYMILIILYSIFHTPKVTRDVISAAVAAYVFIALFFGKIFLMLELMYPGSFSLAHDIILSEPG